MFCYSYDSLCFAGEFEDIGILDCGFFGGIGEGLFLGIGPAAIAFVVIECEAFPASLIGALTFDTSGLAQSALPTNEEVDWHGFSYSFIGPKRESISRFSVSFGVVHHFVRRSQRRFLGWFGSRL